MRPGNARTVFLMLTGTLLASVLALSHTDAADQSQAPAAPEAVAKLAGYIGDWSGTGTMTEGGQTQNASVRHQWISISDGWGIQVHETSDMGEAGTYRCENILGFDPGGGKLHIYSVSNMGDCHDHVGGWKDDSTLAFRYEGITEGKPFVEDITMTLEGPNQYSMRGIRTVAGRQESDMRVTMHRQGR